MILNPYYFTNFFKISVGVCLFLFPSLLFAHSADTTKTGFISGFLHPIFGVDHLIAMFAVGYLSALIAKKSIILIPAVFVMSMIIGGYFGLILLFEMPTEWIIRISIIALGVFILMNNSKLKTHPVYLSVVYLSVGIFGIAHGFAHGEEMPYFLKPQFFILGFATCSILIHILGIVTFIGLNRFINKKMNVIISALTITSGLLVIYFL
ncbi:HupE/UreJ family protein [Marinicellulosiphila megalodicopiae]|uniref:HupE/UreJ family protein n=1 Tax=Marinicellulosiphila megalodicopiae TaxID=2724896 RepID=UPI003BB1B3F3